MKCPKCGVSRRFVVDCCGHDGVRCEGCGYHGRKLEFKG